MPDHCEHDGHGPHEHDREQQPAPAPPTMRVGSVDDAAEADADKRAHAALGWLGAQPAVDASLGEASGVSRIHRSASATAGAEIGAEGGDLDRATHDGIESARSSGRPMEGPVRSSMESAFGADLGNVRIHDTPAADRISRSISAEAFTTGNDVFFSRGAYDPDSARGQYVLAHELGHVMQHRGGVHRLWNPFKKSPEKVAREAAESEKKKALVAARAELKAKDAAARLEAKRVNTENAAQSAKIKAAHTSAPNSKIEKPAELKALEVAFHAQLEKEREARARAQADFATASTPQEKETAEVAEEKAADAAWSGVAPEVRAFRPLRFDDFDRALNEVRELLAAGKLAESQEAAQLAAANEKAHGAPMDPKKAVEKVQQQRALDQRRARITTGGTADPAAAAASSAAAAVQDKTDADAQAAEKLAEAKGTGDSARAVGPGEEARIRADAAAASAQEKYGRNADQDTAAGALGIAGAVGNYGGKATASGTKATVKTGLGGATEGTDSHLSSVVGTSTTGLGQVLAMISDILTFASTVSDIRSGAADKGASAVATRKAVSALNNATGVTRSGLLAAREGVQTFGGAGNVISEAGSALPIVGLITSVLSVIDGSLALMPLSGRLGSGLESVDQAALAGKGPLAASLDRVNSRNAQLVEKTTFGIAKSCTMLGLHIAELATAGGFGIPMAAKLTVSITGAAHSLGHLIYDTVGESRSSTAKKAFGVKHEEGASRDVLKYDIGSSVDVLIVAAQKHKLDYATKTLLEYGVTAAEIDGMRLHELRAKILEGLSAEGDPKTVGEKVEAAGEAVKGALGIEKKPTGTEQETTVLEDLRAVPAGVKNAIVGLPAKIRAKIAAIEENHADARELVTAKNSLSHHGRDDRGKASQHFYANRGAEANEESFAKVRADLAATGVAADALPRSAADKRKRAELAAAQLAAKDKTRARQIDKAFIAQVTDASDLALFDILGKVNQKDPAQLGNLAFLEWEVARRMAASGAMGGGR